MKRFLLSILILCLGSYSFAQILKFYSPSAAQRQIRYSAIYKSDFTTLEQVKELSYSDRKDIEKYEIAPILSYLFGPAVYRQLGAPQRRPQLVVNWENAELKEGIVYIPYNMTSDWILQKTIKNFSLPVPYNKELLLTSNWKNCSDSDPNHQTVDFFWYFWEPSRPGCDHKENIQYQVVPFEIISETLQSQQTFPEYQRLLNDKYHQNSLSMTFAFGYVETPDHPLPENDIDAGALEYRKFLDVVRTGLDFEYQESLILQKEYRTYVHAKEVMGHRFSGQRNGVQITINVLLNGEIDQMEVFSKSFAHDHDNFFAWAGHSRLGQGFDADYLYYRLSSYPEYYSITDEYQLIYWGGCNSYSYYALPFFDMKKKYYPQQDPTGTKNLDLVVNGLPSYFAMGSVNMNVFLQSLVHWEQRWSYQSIVDSLETQTYNMMGVYALVAALGDEDNVEH